MIKDKDSSKFIDASNNEMSIAGRCEADVYIPQLKKTFKQEFFILNTKTYKTLLLGRDFLAQTGPVTIDVAKNGVKIGNKLITAITPGKKLRVNTSEQLTVPLRSETIISVKSKNRSALLVYDFFPTFKGLKGIYVAKAKVQPDFKSERVRRDD